MSTGGKAAYKSTVKNMLGDTYFISRSECVYRGADILWWDLEAGSRCHFWRGTEEFRNRVRNRQQHWFTVDGPCVVRPQKSTKDQTTVDKKKYNLLKW